MNYLQIEQKTLSQVTDQLNELLANYQVYYQNLRNFHWNVKGQHFFDLHEQFESLYHSARENIDAIAERVLTLRQRPMSLLSSYLESSTVTEDTSSEATDMVSAVIENQRVLIGKMRATLKQADSVGDEGTIDLIGGFLAAMEKKTWMLDAWSTQRNN